METVTRTYAVKGAARTAEGTAPKTYTSKNGTKEEALGMLADLRDVQQSAGLTVNARIIEVDADGNEVVPAERTFPGVGPQRVNRFDDAGEFLGQHRHIGTIGQARASAALLGMHDTHPDYAATVAELRDTAAVASGARFPAILAETRGSHFFAALDALNAPPAA